MVTLEEKIGIKMREKNGAKMVEKRGAKIFSEISEKGLTRVKMLDIIGDAKKELGDFSCAD